MEKFIRIVVLFRVTIGHVIYVPAFLFPALHDKSTVKMAFNFRNTQI